MRWNPLDPRQAAGRVEFTLMSLLLSIPVMASQARDASMLFSMDLEDLIARPESLSEASVTGAATMVTTAVTWVLYAPVVARRLRDMGHPPELAWACIAPPTLALVGRFVPGADFSGTVIGIILSCCSLYLATVAGKGPEVVVKSSGRGAPKGRVQGAGRSGHGIPHGRSSRPGTPLKDRGTFS